MKATSLRVFRSRFYNHITDLLGGPAKEKAFFRVNPKIRQLEAIVAERSHIDGCYGFTPKGAAEEWFRVVIKSMLPVEISK